MASTIPKAEAVAGWPGFSELRAKPSDRRRASYASSTHHGRLRIVDTELHK